MSGAVKQRPGDSKSMNDIVDEVTVALNFLAGRPETPDAFWRVLHRVAGPIAKRVYDKIDRKVVAEIAVALVATVPLIHLFQGG